MFWHTEKNCSNLPDFPKINLNSCNFCYTKGYCICSNYVYSVSLKTQKQNHVNACTRLTKWFALQNISITNFMSMHMGKTGAAWHCACPWGMPIKTTDTSYTHTCCAEVMNTNHIRVHHHMLLNIVCCKRWILFPRSSIENYSY